MSTPVPWPMLVDYFSPFTSWCDSVLVNDCCLLTVGNDGSMCSVSENTALSETGDVSASASSNVPILDSGAFCNKSATGSDFVVSVGNDRSIEYERISLEVGTAEGVVGVSESKILVELENGEP